MNSHQRRRSHNILSKSCWCVCTRIPQRIGSTCVLFFFLTRSHYQVKPATLLIPVIDLYLISSRSNFVIPGTQVAPFYILRREQLTGDRVNCVSHMLYADDLGLTTNDPGEMQTMLNKLRTYAEKKGLTVNSRRWFVLIASLPLRCRIRSRTMVWCFQRKTGSNIWACCLIEGWIRR